MCPYLNTAISVLIVLWARCLRAGDMNLDCLEADCRNLNHPKTPLQVYHLVSLWVMFSVFIGYVNKCLLLAAWWTKIKRTSRFKIVQFLIFSNAIKSTFWWERQRECQLVSVSIIKSWTTRNYNPELQAKSTPARPAASLPPSPHSNTSHPSSLTP